MSPCASAFRRPGRIVSFRGPAADTSQPSFPIRAAFYYAWYPEAWFRDPAFPYSLFRPSLDYYSAADAHVVRNHTEALRYAHLNAGIYSWWGADGYPPTDLRFWRYLAAARTTPFRWAAYYEREGYENPSVEKIRSDLEYLRDSYATKPAYSEGRWALRRLRLRQCRGRLRLDGCALAGGEHGRRVHRVEGVRRLSHLQRATGRVASVLRGASRVRPRARLVHDRARLRRDERGGAATRPRPRSLAGGRRARCSRRTRVGSSC